MINALVEVEKKPRNAVMYKNNLALEFNYPKKQKKSGFAA